MLLGTDVPDELCEVAEICSGTSLISSAIISCGVHHLHELRKKIKLLLLLLICCTCHVLSVPFTQLEICQVFRRRRGGEDMHCVLSSAEKILGMTDDRSVGVLKNIWPIAWPACKKHWQKRKKERCVVRSGIEILPDLTWSPCVVMPEYFYEGQDLWT